MAEHRNSSHSESLEMLAHAVHRCRIAIANADEADRQSMLESLRDLGIEPSRFIATIGRKAALGPDSRAPSVDLKDELTLPPDQTSIQHSNATDPTTLEPRSFSEHKESNAREDTQTPVRSDETITVGPGKTRQNSATLSQAFDSSRAFGDYEIISEIARGGMGVVYKARQISLNRTVALKKVLSGQLAGDEDIRRFRIEAEASAQLDHPGIVPVYDFGQSDGQHYFSMGLVEGRSLADRIAESPLQPKDAAKLLIKIGRAVAYANERGVIHRDLKPGNVLLDKEGEPRITDFGLAKKSTDNSGVTATGQILGTPSYMPPEQASGKADAVDHRADVYALGAILYAMLTGRPPFQAANAMETMIQVLEQEPVSIRQLVPNASRDLETICLKCLHKKPERRYASGNAFADDLQRWLNGEPIVARRVTRAERVWKWCKRKPVVVASAVTIALMFVVGSIVFWERQNAAYADGRVESLLKADATEANGIIAELKDYRRWADEPLRETFQQSSDGSVAKLHSGMALVAFDDAARTYVAQQLLLAKPTQFQALVEAMANHISDAQIAEYWAIANDPQEDRGRRFHAACAVANFDRNDARWQERELQDFVASQLVSVLPSELRPWRNSLQPVKEQMVRPLGVIYRDSTATDQARAFAADTLGDYLSRDAKSLFDLLADANLEQFPITFSYLRNFESQAIELGNSELSESPDTLSPFDDREHQSIRKANTAILLLKLEAPEQAWRVLRHSSNPRARSHLIKRLSTLNIDPQWLAARFEIESDISIQRALLLSLGEYDVNQIPESLRASLVDRLFGVYRNHPDAGLHASAEWLLRHWGEADRLAHIDQDIAQSEDDYQSDDEKAKDWYVTKQGLTFAIFDAGEFLMGSPEDEADHQPDELQHRRRINRRLAFSTKEVTKSQFREFETGKESVIAADNPNVSKFVLTEDSPMVSVTWYEAAWYCNWLSEQEGIPEDQWVYDTNEDGEYGPGMKAKENFWELTGYRLPTEAEWEFACRANAVTSRYYGESDSVLGDYARYHQNSDNHLWPVAERKPNDFGLFGMLGNCFEWCFNSYDVYPDSSTSTVDDAPDTSEVQDTEPRVVRGGSNVNFAWIVRSAYRLKLSPYIRFANYGLRPVRTLPRSE